jgi:hypothetical protein
MTIGYQQDTQNDRRRTSSNTKVRLLSISEILWETAGVVIVSRYCSIVNQGCGEN